MGKKSKLKIIRKVARELTEINTKRLVGERIIGSELIKLGVTELKNGDKVKQNEWYINKSVQEVPLNHNRKMKQLYNKYGEQGVQQYINLVNQFVAQEKLKNNVKEKD